MQIVRLAPHLYICVSVAWHAVTQAPWAHTQQQNDRMRGRPQFILVGGAPNDSTTTEPNISSTPSFVINGELIQNMSYDELKKVIDGKLK